MRSVLPEQEKELKMQKTIRLWEVLSAFAALCTGFGIIIWNIYTMVIENKKDIICNNNRVDKLEKHLDEYRQDVKEINKNLETILIKIENKQDRK